MKIIFHLSWPTLHKLALPNHISDHKKADWTIFYRKNSRKKKIFDSSSPALHSKWRLIDKIRKKWLPLCLKKNKANENYVPSVMANLT
jgi:hypothetical protein